MSKMMLTKSELGRFWGSFLLFSCVFGQTCEVFAGIATDGTVGQAQTLAGPKFNIPETLGSLKGSNLFHSFSTFSINKNESATFTGSSSIQSVISRVTGGEVSNIDGLLKSEIGKADFYFINPAGVVFGANARVDVPASFHVGAADEIRFADGSVFSAKKPESSTLSIATPESFGFLSPQLGNLVINGSSLTFQAGSTVTLTGSDVFITGRQDDTDTLFSPSGSIQVAAMGASSSEGQFLLFNGKLPEAAHGDVALNGALLRVTGAPSGSIKIAGKWIALDHAAVYAAAKDGDGGGIFINANGALTLVNTSDLSANNVGSGAGSKIEVTAHEIAVLGGSVISSRSTSSGASGGILLKATGNITVSGEDSDGNHSSILVGAQGNAATSGSLVISADRLFVKDNGSIVSGTLGNGMGAVLEINANSIDISNAGSVVSLNVGKGLGGDIIIKTSEDVTLSGENTSIASSMDDGAGGDITFKIGGDLKMTDKAVISIGSPPLSQETGRGGNLVIHAKRIELESGATLYAASEDRTSTGTVGSVMLDADESIIFRGARTGIDMRNRQDGDVGNIKIHTPALSLLDGAMIYAFNSYDEQGSRGADILIDVDTLNITNADKDTLTGFSEIVASATGKGDGGRIIINAAKSVVIDGKDKLLSAGIRTSSKDGTAGILIINTDNLEMKNNATVMASTDAGQGGALQFNVGTLTLSGGLITTNAMTGNAGDITINAKENIQIEGNQSAKLVLSKASVVEAAAIGGQAGRLVINTSGLDVGKGGMLSASTIGAGDGGKIVIDADNITLHDGGKIVAVAKSSGDDSELVGTAGDIIINANELLTVKENSSILTESSGSDGGRIVVGGNAMLLQNGRVSTSVYGKQGDGGNIGVLTDVLIMDTGFIQANTTAHDAHGGNILIDTDYLITPNATPPEVGGNTRMAFMEGSGINVIQAAAPGGEQGRIVITSPEINISGALASIHARELEPAKLADDPCRNFGTKNASTLYFEKNGAYSDDGT